MNFDAYKQWRDMQTCIDCGEPASARGADNQWATETQCCKCFTRLGPPELRGLTGAAEAFATQNSHTDSEATAGKNLSD